MHPAVQAFSQTLQQSRGFGSEFRFPPAAGAGAGAGAGTPPSAQVCVWGGGEGGVGVWIYTHLLGKDVSWRCRRGLQGIAGGQALLAYFQELVS